MLPRPGLTTGAADLDLMTATDAAAQLNVSRAWATRLAVQHNVGWHTGRDWVFTPHDVKCLRVLMALNPRGGNRRPPGLYVHLTPREDAVD